MEVGLAIAPSDIPLEQVGCVGLDDLEQLAQLRFQFVHSLLGFTKRQVRAQLTRKADPHGNPLFGRHLDVQRVRAMFDALGHAESMCVALSRAVRMVARARQTISTLAAVPSQIDTIERAVLAIRDAFEHIDERAVGRARNEDAGDAMSVFDQSDFFVSGVLRYAVHSLDIRAEVLPALIAGRRFIVEAATKAGLRKTINQPIQWTFTEE